jgi:ATP-dependent RNA helicase RhlE
MSFKELRLAKPIVRAVAAEGYDTPTPIQMKAIPAVLAGEDVLGCAQTGTGKTGAFALPTLQRLGGHHAQRRGRRPRALVLCPTRELATQILESFNAYGRYLPLRHAVVFGGVSQAGQVRALRAGVDVLVATPGRLLDLIEQRIVDLRSIEVLVLDEADRMLDMGFIHDIRRIVARVPARRQTLFFSATMPDQIRRLADSILSNPTFVQAAPVATPAESIRQSYYVVTRPNKLVLLERLLRHDALGRTLVFSRTKHGADKLVKVLRRAGVEAEAIHGNKSQNARTRALAGFKNGRTPVLVATDIASRGIDVDDITHVINFDMPHDAETYVHRIGRTARAGSSGTAFSFCGPDQLDELRTIERLMNVKLVAADDHTDLVVDLPRQRNHAKNRPARTAGADASRRQRRRRPRSRSRRSVA